MHGGTVVIGGNFDIKNKYVAPTVIDSPRENSKMMMEEIFGPILPVFSFDKIENVIDFINLRPKPLAIYYYGSKNSKKLQYETSSGAFSRNESLFHILNNSFPFGGVGQSGYGAYHGIHGFNNCSHLKSVFNKMTLNSFPYSERYPPYTLKR